MVQVDIFWSYGLGSGLALAAGKNIRQESSPWGSFYFAATIIWIATIFAPSGMYLLWAFPYWETMFLARNHDSIPAWLVTLFALTNITQGILGYYVTWRCVRAGRNLAAKIQPVWSQAMMLFILIFGWDGSGFKRFTYSGNGDQWAQGVDLPWTAFFTSPVFFALLGMAVFFIPSYAYLVSLFMRPRKET